MTSDADRERVAAEIRRIRKAVQDRRLDVRDPAEVLPPPPEPRVPEAAAPQPQPDPEPPPARPDGGAVNRSWDVRGASSPSFLGRLARRLLAPLVEAQTAFNSHQVQLDNALLDYVDARFAHTHRHYDHVLGLHGRHLGEIDERHLILQEELVAHVHDLVARIDLVLGESERGRLGVEHALRELRARLTELEERLQRG